MKIKIILSAIILSTPLIFFYGCSDTLTSTSGVTGKVFGYGNFPVPGLRVSIGDKVTHTSSDGSFGFENIAYPYDIILLDSSFDRSATIYKNISTDKLNLSVNISGSKSIYSNIIIQLPQNIDFKTLRGKAIFTNEQNVNEYMTLYDYSNHLTVRLPDLNPITGKLLILIYKRDKYYKITSYENYGESAQLNLIPENTIEYTFDSLSLSLNPGEQLITGSYNIPSGASGIYSYYSITFGNKFQNYEGELSSFEGREFSFIVPKGIPRAFKTFISNSALTNSGSSYETFQVYPFTSNTLSIKDACILINPQDQSKGITNETEFSFQDGTGDGVYSIALNDVSRNVTFRIITKERTFNLVGLDQLGLGRINNNNFYWYVTKAGPAESVNDYTTNYLEKQEKFITYSNSRNFSTLP